MFPPKNLPLKGLKYFLNGCLFVWCPKSQWNNPDVCDQYMASILLQKNNEWTVHIFLGMHCIAHNKIPDIWNLKYNH